MNLEILTEEEMRRAIGQIFKRSQTDLAFRKLCLDDPNEALRQIAGKAVPSHVKIHFLDSVLDKAADGRDGTN